MERFELENSRGVQGGTETGRRLEQYVMEQRKVCGVSDVLSQDTPTKNTGIQKRKTGIIPTMTRNI